MNLKSLNSQDLDPDHSMKRGVEHSVIEEDEEFIEEDLIHGMDKAKSQNPNFRYLY